MMPGPTIIKQCLECSQRIGEPTLCSGNTYGATYWTDGKCEALMLPMMPTIVKCPKCEAFLWLEDLEAIGEHDPFASNISEDFELYDELVREEYLAEANTKQQSLKREKYLRVSAWWMGNDERRQGSQDKPLSEVERENLIALADLCGETPNDRVMKAEIFRELGDFPRAIDILGKIKDDDLMWVVKSIQALADHKVSMVHELKEAEEDDGK